MIVHFSLVFIHCNRSGSERSKLDYFSHYYIYPYFQQTWGLFAPAPDSNYQLIARYNKGGKQTKDIFAEIVWQHQSNRLRGNEQLLLAFATSIHYFEKTALEHKENGGIIENNRNFKIIEHMARRYLTHTVGDTLSELQLTLVVKDIETGLQRVYYNRPEIDNEVLNSLN